MLSDGEALVESAWEDAQQIVLRDGHALPADVYALTRRVFIKLSQALGKGRE